MKFAVLAFAAALIAAPPAFAEPEVWTPDYNHSEVRFSWDHWGVSTQHGEFEKFTIDLALDPENIERSTVSATIDVTSIHTAAGELDRHLQGPNWFNAPQFHDMRFVSTAVHRTGLNTALVDGRLTIRGVEKPATLAVALTFDGEHPLAAVVDGFRGRRYRGFVAHTTVLRSDFGMTQSRPYISDEIGIDITAEVTRRPSDAAAPPAR